jgi:VWFA-related protein
MFPRKLIGVCFGVMLTVVAQGQQNAASSPASQKGIHFGVIVTERSGADVAGLEEKDFSVTDGKTAKPITSFKAMSLDHDPVHVVIVIDEINTRFTTNSYVRQEMEKYLRATGHLVAPTSIATLAYSALQYHPNYTQDGAALADWLETASAGLRQGSSTTSSEGGVQEDNVQKSVIGLDNLARQLSSIPGRKVVLWLSPGWPLMNTPGMQIDEKPQQSVFTSVVALTTGLRLINTIIYNIYPVSPTESSIQTTNYQDYLKGVPRSTQANFGNLALQVFSAHSGGLVLDASNNISAMVAKCLADTKYWYEITVDPTAADKPNEYHHLQVKVDKPGVVVRAIDGYYAQQQ